MVIIKVTNLRAGDFSFQRNFPACKETARLRCCSHTGSWAAYCRFPRLLASAPTVSEVPLLTFKATLLLPSWDLSWSHQKVISLEDLVYLAHLLYSVSSWRARQCLVSLVVSKVPNISPTSQLPTERILTDILLYAKVLVYRVGHNTDMCYVLLPKLSLKILGSVWSLKFTTFLSYIQD